MRVFVVLLARGAVCVMICHWSFLSPSHPVLFFLFTETAASTVATATSTADVEDALQAARDGYITFMESMGAGADDLETGTRG